MKRINPKYHLILKAKGAWTTELADEQTEEAEEYHIDVRYNMDTDELIDVKKRMEHPIDTNLSVMGQAEQLINQLEAEKNIFTSEERNLIVNYAYKLDDNIVVLHQNGQNTAHLWILLDIRKYRIFYGSRHRKRKKCRTLLDTMSKDRTGNRWR